jgi:hypothetical protein
MTVETVPRLSLRCLTVMTTSMLPAIATAGGREILGAELYRDSGGP